MKNQYDKKSEAELTALRNAIVGLGDHSGRKNYYPELRKRLGELERFRRLVDRINDFVFVLDVAKDSIIDVNQTACGRLGYDKQVILDGKGCDFIDNLNIGNSFEQQLVRSYLLCQDGRRVPVELTLSSIEIEGVQYQMIVARDITEQILASDELLASSELAQAASRSKSEFLANMSHEIRTPLNSILGFSDLLSETILDGEQEQLIRMIRRAGANLLILINDVLDLSKIEAGKMKLESTTFDFRELVEGNFEILANEAKGKGLLARLAIASDIPKFVFGDGQRLRQVITNLLGNAIKFTACGRIDMACQLERLTPDECEIVFEFKDTGVGISPSRIQDLFGRFIQLDSSSTRSFGGTGLGLNISKQLVEMMGGQISAESEIGVGSTFRFWVPLGLGSRRPVESELLPSRVQPVTAAVTLPVSECPALKVLVAEDSKDNQDLIRMYLKNLPFSLVFVENGSMAVKRFKGGGFDLVLMDMEMPVLDGYSAARAIRSWERECGRPATPIIAQTAHAMAVKIKESQQAGCCMHLAKPIKKAALIQAILSMTVKSNLSHPH